MTIKLIQAVNLRQLYPKFKEKVLPIKTTYKISKLFKVIEEESEFYTTNLNKIITDYAEKDENGVPVLTEDGKGVQLKQEDIAKAEQAITELWDLDIEIPDVQFSFDELEPIELTVEEFNYLLPFISE